MHSRLGSATLSQLAFPEECSPNFTWKKLHWDNTVVKKKKKFHDPFLHVIRARSAHRQEDISKYNNDSNDLI